MSGLDKLLSGAQAASVGRIEIDVADFKALVVGDQHLTRYRDAPASNVTLFDVLRQGL